jgi:hypothetical protein
MIGFGSSSSSPFFFHFHFGDSSSSTGIGGAYPVLTFLYANSSAHYLKLATQCLMNPLEIIKPS